MQSHKKRIDITFGKPLPKSMKEIDHKLIELVGSFFESIYSVENDKLQNRILIDMTNHVCTCCKSCGMEEDEYESKPDGDRTPVSQEYTKHEMIRDLFLWSVFMDMPEMAKVLLLHLRSRTCAALIASAIFKRYSKLSQTIDMKERFRAQSLEFGTYAAVCIDKCYEYNKKRACELLLREIPLFGNVTCMQVGKIVQ